MKKCPNGHEVNDNLKFCPKCGAELIEGGSKFCKKCGTERKGTEKFCSKCGTPFDGFSMTQQTSQPQPSYDEEETPADYKKIIIPIVIGLIVLALIGGVWWYYDSHKKDILSKNEKNVESVAVDSIPTKNTIMDNTAAKEAFQKILSSIFSNVADSLTEESYVRMYYSSTYRNNYSKARKKAERESCEYPRLWWQYSDSDPEGFNINEVEMISSKEAKASVDISSELYIGKYEVRLIEENGKWVIDNVNEISVQGNPDFNKSEESNEESYNEDYSNNNSYSSSNTSSSRTFANEQYVTMYLANQTFRSSNGFTIRFDGDLRMYAEGDFAGVVSVLRYNSTAALLRYGGGQYTEGKISVQIVGDRLQLTDPVDGTIYYQK